MRDVLMLTAAVLAAVAGMGWLALAMESHWSQVRGAQGRSRAGAHRLRALGMLALAGSLAGCLAVDHASMAVLVWVMALAAGALAVALALSFRPRWLRLLSRVG